MKIKPFVLVILDGWGYSSKTEHNAIAQANTPNWDHWWQTYPHTLISGSGNDVGLPEGQMGNSEVGHMHIGAGRQIAQDYSRINQAISDGSFFTNSILLKHLQYAAKQNKVVHILGLTSPGGVHSHEDHIAALIKLAGKTGAHRVQLHAFLDGRDTPPRSALPSLQKLRNCLTELHYGCIASISGRYYAMDRDNRWERIQQCYNAITRRQAQFSYPRIEDALEAAYNRGENDEFVQPTLITNDNNRIKRTEIHEDDVIIFMNFRADRARQLTRALTEQTFSGFARPTVPNKKHFITLTQYADDIKVDVAFPPEKLTNTLGEYLANKNLHQLRIAETEKYAHVTFFMNGRIEQPFLNEDRILIPSPDVSTYDLKPEMSAKQITNKIIDSINSQQHDVIIANYANADMVGHTGNFDATVKAIECLDRCLGEIYIALKNVGGEMLITADHGNAEKMHDNITQQPHTAHTSEPVPLLYLGRNAEVVEANGTLADVAPTILTLLNLPIPKQMTGRPLFLIPFS